MISFKRPDIHVAPPLIFIAGFLAGATIEWLWLEINLVRGSASQAPLRVAGVVLMHMGAALALWGVHTFRRAKTTIMPFRAPSAMVRRGPYRFTRNPMYVGMTLGYVGLSLFCNVGWPLILLPIVLFTLVKLVITREETYLESVFGDDYRDYRQSVRRWL